LETDEWSSVAQESGRILALDRYAIIAACTKAAEWNRERTEPMTVWVTVGAQHLLRGDLLAVITRAVDETRAGPGSLGIELSHAAIACYPREAESVLHSLSWLGVRVALTNFGLEPFTLAQLQKFRVDTLKLDREMASSLGTDPDVIVATGALATLAHSLGLR